jgi:DNA polymerase III sliding clamp (beta) subunit (PCNA family)
MTVLFKAKTQEAYVIKILAELLSNNIKTGCFVIDENGIYLCMMDSHKTILIDLVLKAENFSIYKFNSKKMYLGINLVHFHRMARSIKKKDSIELFIEEKSQNDLGIKVIPKENNRTTISYVKIQSIQNLDIDIPVGYGKPIIVNSSDFQKMIKEMSSIGTTMKVVSSNHKIEFACNAGGILKRKVQFGEDDEDDDLSAYEYSQEFITEQLCRITKLSGLGSNMQIYTGKPLLFVSNVGNLGKISIYIKSKEQIETENYNTIESDYDSD